eukprot:2478477-Rhodomonas_salina.1
MRGTESGLICAMRGTESGLICAMHSTESGLICAVRGAEARAEAGADRHAEPTPRCPLPRTQGP